MFPSSGHFRFLHCPFHLDGHCGRIYCHFRHVKNADVRSVENAELQKLKKVISEALKLDNETFNLLVHEDDENIHEKLLNKKFKTRFPGNDDMIDDFHLPDSVDDIDFPISKFTTVQTSDDLIDLGDDTPLDEGPLKQFLEEDAKQDSNPEHKNRNAIEKRHIIISCLEKIDKREFPTRHPNLQKKNVTTVILRNECGNTDNIATQRLDDSPNLNHSLKEENESDNSDTEVNAEVDKILTQMELMDPQLFNTNTNEDLKSEPTDRNEPSVDITSEETIFSKTFSTPSVIPFLSDNTEVFTSKNATTHNSDTNRVGRINLKSIQAINNEVSSHISTPLMKPENLFESVFKRPVQPETNPLLVAATIAEQNRLKNVFKNTICSNIDQFFDLSDACKVYGTEIFNLLEPLLNYLIEKLNPEFNFQKLQQLHSQNISLALGLPFVTSCEHMKDCIECHNILLSAVSRNPARKCDKSTCIDIEPVSSCNDTPLRKIEAGLYDITKEMLSLGIPVDDQISVNKPLSVIRKNAQCQTESTSRQENFYHRQFSHKSIRKSIRDGERHKSRHESKVGKKDGHEERIHTSFSKRAVHSRSKRRSLTRSKKHEKRSKESVKDESSDQENSSHTKSRRCDEPERKKRPSSENYGTEAKKSKVEVTQTMNNERKKHTSGESDRASPENRDNNLDSDVDIFDSPLSDGLSQSDSDEETVLINGSSDSEIEKQIDNSKEFIDKYPNCTTKKRLSHVSENNSSLLYRKPTVPKKKIPTPQETLYQRMQLTKTPEEPANENSSSSNEKVRISHVPNVALLLKAKERIKTNILHQQTASQPKTVPQTAPKGQRAAHTPAPTPTPKDVPAMAANSHPSIKTFKSSHNIPVHIRQNGLDRLYYAFAKKVPPEIASELALKEEQTIHEKVTIHKVYLNSLAMAIHRIVKENPAKLIVTKTEFPLEINGHAVYDILSRHILTLEQMEINGFPLGIPNQPGYCHISSKAIHYKPIISKRSGERFYCQQCKELFEVSPKTGLPITPETGCRFHSLKPRKEPGRTRHDIYYPCCSKGLSESGCITAEYHTPDTTDDDCLEGFVETRKAPPGERGTKRFYSLDCEMCYTTVGSELTRVTVIGHDCNIVYDSLVKPQNKILDYCTKFSGITEEKMRRVTKTIKQVHQELFKFIFKDTILIGHSLENDLKALKILHYKVVDTSVMYPHRDAPERKFSLKNLSSSIVQYLIQESEFGHDSMEDALACMKLVWKKIKEDAQGYRPRKIISSPVKNS